MCHTERCNSYNQDVFVSACTLNPKHGTRVGAAYLLAHLILGGTTDATIIFMNPKSWTLGARQELRTSLLIPPDKLPGQEVALDVSELAPPKV